LIVVVASGGRAAEIGEVMYMPSSARGVLHDRQFTVRDSERALEWREVVQRTAKNGHREA
jgi:hypothetical protein